MRFGFFDQLPCAGEDSEYQMAVFGDPDYCVERVRALRREYQMDEFIGYFNQGGLMEHSLVKQSMTLFAREVMPRVIDNA